MKKSAQDRKNYLFILWSLFALLIMISGLITLQMISARSARNNSSMMSSSQSYGPLGYGRSMNGSNQKETCLMDGCLFADDAEYPIEELDAQTTEFLLRALADEQKALATYETVMTQFGRIRPFVNIARAEEHHIAMVKALFDKYGVAIPEATPQISNLPKTLPEVCMLAAQAEIENDAMYQEMLPTIEQEDIQTVFTSLAAASREMHLPAFERCAQ